MVGGSKDDLHGVGNSGAAWQKSRTGIKGRESNTPALGGKKKDLLEGGTHSRPVGIEIKQPQR